MPTTDFALDDQIDVRRLIQTSTVEDFNRASDDYFRQFQTWDVILAKPFVADCETPELLITFALVLRGLRALRGMTILDFGAGSGWASRFLAQLGYRVIATDVSETALRMGRESLRRQPLYATGAADPQFLLFDGRRLDLPDESIDRIVCLSAFHHVPNPAEVLGEFARVLKPGGVAGFAEPGPNHSKSVQAQQEMRNFRVVENDVVVEEIWGWAKQVGFTGCDLAVWSPGLALVSLAEYDDLLRPGGRCVRFEDEMRSFLAERRLFFLRKGEWAEPDSRQHRGLRAGLTVEPARLRVPAGAAFHLHVRAQNEGTAIWLPSTAEYGPVRVGTTLLSQGGGRRDFSRHWFPDSGPGVHPGQEASVRLELPPIAEPGQYQLEVDLVSELVCWFSNVGSRPVHVDLEVV